MPGLWEILSCLLVIGAGVSVAFQQVLNANLRVQIGSPWWAGSVSYLVGLIAMASIAVLAHGPRLPNLATTPVPTAWAPWTGGLFGALFIGIAIVMIPRLGAATALALIVVGQMLGSLAFDHWGIMGLQQHAASPLRLAGAALLIGGVILIRM